MLNDIPDDYKNKQVFLNSLGVKGFAWDKETIISFLKDKRLDNVIILGGDVLICENGKLRYTYDNWYIGDKNIQESHLEYCKRSKEEALNYIINYPDKAGTLFSPVLQFVPSG
jgi:hypothetical protein